MLGATALLAGLESRSRSTRALALVAVAGAAAVGTIRSGQHDRDKANGTRQDGASSSEPEVERSITIGKSAEELRQRWLDPKTLPQIMAGFATVRAAGDGRMHWKIEGPLGRTYEWDTEALANQPDGGIGWRSLPNAAIANEGSVRFHQAPADRGTVVTLHLHFGRLGGLGSTAVKLLGTRPLDLAVDAVLRRFKSLVETGEIPTTEHQPAARSNTR